MSVKNALQCTLVAALLLISAGGSFAENGTVAIPEKTPKKELLFFMNPNGRPCQMQDAIIQEMGSTLTDLATVKYVKTTNRDDYPLFGTYGIRGLPLLIILDEKGKEYRRFTPGVQSAEVILSGFMATK